MPMKPFTIKIDDDLRNYIRYWSKKLGISMSELIRRSVVYYITYIKNKKKMD